MLSNNFELKYFKVGKKMHDYTFIFIVTSKQSPVYLSKVHECLLVFSQEKLRGIRS